MAGGISATRFRSLRRLLHPRGRAESGRLLVEGTRAVETVLERASLPDFVCFGPEISDFGRLTCHRAESLGVPVFALGAEQVEQLAQTAHSQEIFAVVAWRPGSRLPDSLPAFVLHVSGVRNPTNMGALLRSAAAFGITTTCSPDSVDTTHPTAVRSGAAAYFDASIYERIELSALRAHLPGHRVIATKAGKGHSLKAFEWFERTILVIGGEAGGATEAVGADTTVSIPCHVESLNAAVAGGILMWEAVRQGKVDV